MLLRGILAVVAMGAGLALAVCPPRSAQAAPGALGEEGITILGRSAARSDFIEARQFRVSDSRLPGDSGQASSRQTVMAWQVSRGLWNGQSLDGLSLVMVQTVAEDGSSRPRMNCYVSHRATPAQRRALVSAYAASQSSKSAGGGGPGDEVKPVDTSSWRIEPAVIRFESQGERVVVHVGTIA